jgi:hypothetical protein
VLFLLHLLNRAGQPDVVAAEAARNDAELHKGAAETAKGEAESHSDTAKQYAETAEQHKDAAETALASLASMVSAMSNTRTFLAALVNMYVVNDTENAPFNTVRDASTVTCDPASNNLTDQENGLLIVAYREAYKVDNTLTPSSTIQDILDTLDP